jgi:hypothetical protein
MSLGALTFASHWQSQTMACVNFIVTCKDFLWKSRYCDWSRWYIGVNKPFWYNKCFSRLLINPAHLIDCVFIKDSVIAIVWFSPDTTHLVWAYTNALIVFISNVNYAMTAFQAEFFDACILGSVYKAVCVCVKPIIRISDFQNPSSRVLNLLYFS